MIASSWQSFRTSKWFKPSLILTGVVGLIIIALLLVPLLIDINTYRSQIVTQLEDRLGRKVSLGNLSLKVFPSIRVGVEEAAIGENPQFAKGDFIKAKSIRLQMGLMSLLRGNPEVGGLELIEPEVSLIKDKVGKWNWATLKPLQEPSKGKEMAPFDLVVENGSFTLIDRTVTPQTESKYSGVNIELDGFSSKSAFDFSVGMTMPGDQAGQMKMSGTTGPIDSANTANTPIDARITMDRVEIASLDRLSGIESTRSGRLTMDIRARGKIAESLSAEGSLLAENLRMVKGVDPSKDPLEADLKLDLRTIRPAGAKENDYALKLERGDLAIGKTRAGVTGTIDRLLTGPLMNLKVKADRAALDSLLESAYAFGFGPPKGTSASGLATVDLNVAGGISSPALKGRIELNDLKFQTEGLPQAIQVSNVKMNCDPSQIVATPFRTTLGQRTAVEVAAFKITDYSKRPRAHAEVSTSKAQIEDLIRIAESFGVRSDVKGSGVASLKAVIDATLGGDATAMTITGTGKVINAKLQTPQLKKPLEVTNTDLNFTGQSARADNLNARLGSSQANGWLQINNFDRPHATFDLRINQLSVPEIQGLLASVDRSQPEFSILPVVSAAPASNLNMTADGQLAIGKALVDRLLFNDVQSRVNLENQILRLDPLSLKLYGGAYQGSAQIDLKSQVPAFALNGGVSGVDLNQFLTGLMGSRSVAYGTTSANFNLSGRGEGSDQLMKSLSGRGNIAISNGKITSFDLMKQVEIFGRFAGLPAGGAGTAFRSLKTNFLIDSGRLTTDDLEIIMDDLQVTGSGSMMLGDEVITDYDILAKLSPALSNRVAGNKDSGIEGGLTGIIGKVTSAAGGFFSDGDSIVVPLKMSGPIGQPSFGLNASVVKQRATERLIGKPGEKSPEPADALKGSLDVFQKKKKIPEN